MQPAVSVTLVIALLSVSGCAAEPRHVPTSFGPGPGAIPPPPRHPKIEGNVKSVSAADIRDVIGVEQQDLLKDYGKVLPIYRVHVHSRNHIEIQFWTPDGINSWRDVHRVKGKWTPDYVARVIISG
jgi:hypothetical protein